MRFASASRVRIQVARSGGVMPSAASSVRATPTSEEKADSQSCRSARAMACRRSRDSNSFSALRCIRPTRGSAAVTRSSSTVSGQLEPGVGRRVVLEQRQPVVAGKVAGGTDADHEFRCHAVMVSEQRDQPDRGTTSTSCRGRRQAVYAP